MGKQPSGGFVFSDRLRRDITQFFQDTAYESYVAEALERNHYARIYNSFARMITAYQDGDKKHPDYIKYYVQASQLAGRCSEELSAYEQGTQTDSWESRTSGPKAPRRR